MLMRAFARIEGVDPATVYECISNQKIRRSWDKAVTDFEIIENYPEEGRSIIYYIMKTPIGISNRDFLQ